MEKVRNLQRGVQLNSLIYNDAFSALSKLQRLEELDEAQI